MITREEVIDIAREAGAPDWWLGIGLGGEVSGNALQWIERFAAVVEARAAAAEREACKQAADEQWVKDPRVSGGDTIRARGAA